MYLHQFMRTIILALLVFVVLSTCQQAMAVAYSGDNSVTVSSNQQGNQTSGPSNAKNSKTTTQSQIKPLPPQNWDILKEKSLGGDSKWITPTASLKIYPIYWLTTYTYNFTATCTKAPFLLTISATGLFQVFLNGALVQNWHNPWPSVAKITLKAKCGVNTIKVVVFNYLFASPAAVIYSLTQNTTGCYICLTPHFYNRQTCQCECIQNVFCLFNYHFDKRLCKCVSNCPKPLACNRGQVWDPFKCRCTCLNKPANCTGLAKWNPNTCSCFCINTVLCIKGFYFDPKLCKCVKTPIQINQLDSPTLPVPPPKQKGNQVESPTLPLPPPKQKGNQVESPTLPLPPPKQTGNP